MVKFLNVAGWESCINVIYNRNLPTFASYLLDNRESSLFVRDPEVLLTSMCSKMDREMYSL